MHFKKNRKGYVCGNFNKHGSKACSSHIIIESALSDIVLSKIKKLVIDIKNTDLFNNLKLQIDNDILNLKADLKKYDTELDSLKKRKSKSISMLIDEVISKSDYDLFVNDIDEQLKSIEHKKFLATQSLDKLLNSSPLNELNRIKNEEIPLNELTSELLHRFIKRIDVEEDGTPQITYKLIETISN